MRRRLLALLGSLVLFSCEAGERGTHALPPEELPPEVRLDAEARARGRVLYLDHCVLCHGERGDGRGVRRAGLSRAPADFTNPVWRQHQTPAGVFRAIRQGVPGSDMPAWKQLDDDEVWALVAYVLSLGEA
jgi:mono/diheme cytochrome c family protein